MNNRQKAVAVTTIDSDPGTRNAPSKPHRMAVWPVLRAVARF